MGIAFRIAACQSWGLEVPTREFQGTGGENPFGLNGDA